VTCLRGTTRNLACGVEWNIYCDDIKAVVGSFGIAITMLGHLYSVLSCHFGFLEALLALHACRADNQVSCILIGSRSVKPY
jgi:hypothetical protein